MAKNSGKVTDIVANAVLPICDEMGLKIWDVTFEKEGADWFLKVLIEKDKGELDILECEAFSRRIDPIIDELDPIEQSYYLEVGSPGLGRKLRTREHFERFVGESVYVRLIRPNENGEREITAKLLGVDNITISLEEIGEIKLSETAFVKLCDDNI